MHSSAPVGPSLPSRYDEILDKRMAEARRVLQQAQTMETPQASRPMVVALVVALAVVVLFGFVRQPAGRPTGALPFDRASVVSADTLGVAALAEDLVPPPPQTTAVSPAAPAAPAPEPVPAEPVRPRRLRLRPLGTPTVEPSKLEARAVFPQPQFEEIPIEDAELDVPAVAVSPAAVVNVGTRLRAVLSGPVMTGSSAAPVAARVSEDIVIGGDVAVPTGATLVGEAIATRQDDRAQIVFNALVAGGVTHPIRAMALAEDGQVGLTAALVRKASTGKRGLGRALGAVGSALTLGLVAGPSNPGKAAAEHLALASATDLAELDRRWSEDRSDKVLRVSAGVPFLVYLEADLKLR